MIDAFLLGVLGLKRHEVYWLCAYDYAATIRGGMIRNLSYQVGLMAQEPLDPIEMLKSSDRPTDPTNRLERLKERFGKNGDDRRTEHQAESG